MSGVLELAPSRLYALPLVFGLDRARSMFPPAARGFGSANCYLLKEGDRALLIDTGFPAFRAEVLGLLDGMLEPSTELSIIVLRPAEISAVGNLFAILEQRDVHVLYGALARNIVHSFDPRTLAERGAQGASERRYEQLRGAQELELGPGRRLHVFKPLLQLLNQLWIYDEQTRTMFTSEYFGHVTAERAEGPWTVEDIEADPTTVESLAAFLGAGNRTWWLRGADGETLAGWVDATFAARPVECIAPAFGAILRDRDVVAHAVRLMREALLRLGREALVPAGSPR